jgi:predicted XRE-type DNA-binding protein
MKNVEKYKEIWMGVVGYENNYMISNFGRVKNVKTGRILKQNKVKGYNAVGLCKNRQQETLYIHRLVMENFVPNLFNKKTVNHIDGNKLNNFLNNLEWASQSDNVYHSYKVGLASNRGEKNNRAKLTEKEVTEIRTLSKTLRQGEIAKRYGVTQAAVSSIITGKNWNYI